MKTIIENARIILIMHLHSLSMSELLRTNYSHNALIFYFNVWAISSIWKVNEKYTPGKKFPAFPVNIFIKSRCFSSFSSQKWKNRLFSSAMAVHVTLKHSNYCFNTSKVDRENLLRAQARWSLCFIKWSSGNSPILNYYFWRKPLGSSIWS